ncbi:endonuclease/exonuclease/phosphatase family protein [Loktanella sp. TSTF-M6]|uniref:Endonuclease/exonuclease/phosphatase family protein n=1 Tax=Loktanella gaetbuli TaxID=2881335 RepID=A0ABS8BSI4_9RHOB|nr:endonuclease/exonuclease/phosphatase family protein [Loktanella gaetbuli]MCB5198688.1 endonuclease/exonuclease/phosphatase family protein [Loktanella gaetbuli]
MISILLWGLTGFVIVMTIVPLLRVSHGFVRSADFPRQQVLLLLLVLIPLAIWLQPEGALWMIAALVLCGLNQGFYIGRYLPIWHTQSTRPAVHEAIEPGHTISLIAANVKKSNRDYDRLIQLVRTHEPDIVTALETDADWIEGLSPLADRYPHVMSQPYDNGYGMAIFSKYALEEAAFRNLVVDEVPSLRARITLPSGQAFRLYVTHPEPPVPYQSTEGRDAELGAIGIEVSDDPLPAIVTGDMNDVAWSITTKRFQNVSGLLDPRVGRGFYNTFSARMPLMRWPLDHLFHDARFRLIDMKRLPDINSDHYPMYFKLLLTPQEAAESRPEDATSEELNEVEEMVDRERRSDREAIGSNWEDED